MKKQITILIAIILAGVVCVTLVVFGGGETPNTDKGGASAEMAIVGEWKTLDGYVTAFNEDGTGTAPYGGEFSWKYDTETEWYMMSLEGMTYSCEIKNEDGIRFINLEGKKYYHADDYERAAEANK